MEQQLTLRRIRHEAGKIAFFYAYIAVVIMGALFISSGLIASMVFHVDVLKNSFFLIWILWIFPALFLAFFASYPMGRILHILHIRYLKKEIVSYHEQKEALIHIQDFLEKEMIAYKEKAIIELNATIERKLLEFETLKGEMLKKGKENLARAHTEMRLFDEDLQHDTEHNIAILQLRSFCENIIEELEDTLCDNVSDINAIKEKIKIQRDASARKITEYFETSVIQREKHEHDIAECTRKASEAKSFLYAHYH